jgi:hypothetical protein
MKNNRNITINRFNAAKNAGYSVYLLLKNMVIEEVTLEIDHQTQKVVYCVNGYTIGFVTTDHEVLYGPTRNECWDWVTFLKKEHLSQRLGFNGQRELYRTTGNFLDRIFAM